MKELMKYSGIMATIIPPIYLTLHLLSTGSTITPLYAIGGMIFIAGVIKLATLKREVI